MSKFLDWLEGLFDFFSGGPAPATKEDVKALSNAMAELQEAQESLLRTLRARG